jgi:predicted ATP-dependent Lon-type protease
VPEQGGRDLISADPLSPGTVYTAGVTSDGTVGLYRLEVSISGGNGKLKMAGGISGAMKESVQRAFSYVQAKKADLGIARDLETSDVHVEVIDLLGNRVEAEIGVAFFCGGLLGLSKGARQSSIACAWRHERAGKYQTSPISHGAASSCEGQWCKTVAYSDREQTKFP